MQPDTVYVGSFGFGVICGLLIGFQWGAILGKGERNELAAVKECRP